MQSSTGQYPPQTGDPAQPVQPAVMTASSFGFFLRGVIMPFERGSCFSSSGTIPGAFAAFGPVAIELNYIPGSHFDPRLKLTVVVFPVSTVASCVVVPRVSCHTFIWYLPE